MSLRAKLFMFFIILALLPIALADFFTVRQSARQLERRVIAQLEGIADVQVSRINETVDRYLEQVSLVTSRTQLRVLLNSIDVNGVENSEGDIERVATILRDAKRSVSDIKNITLYTPDKEFIYATNEKYIIPDVDIPEVSSLQNQEVANLFRDVDNILRARIFGPVIFNGKVVAIAEVISSASPIISVTEDYTGLGDTGEVELGVLNDNGDALFLTPLRFDSEAALNRVVSKDLTHRPIIVASYGQERVLVDASIEDYKGDSVIAVTRYINSLNWGLVAKIDRAEALAETQDISRAFLTIGVASAAVSLLVAFYLSRVITQPIDYLRTAAKKITNGEYTKRVRITSNDEIGELSRAFNTMTNQLELTYEQLENKVQERTKELEEARKKTEVKLDDTEKLNEIMVDREVRMVELKERIEELEAQLKKEHKVNDKKQ